MSAISALRRLPKVTESIVELALAFGVGLGTAGAAVLYLRQTLQLHSTRSAVRELAIRLKQACERRVLELVHSDAKKREDVPLKVSSHAHALAECVSASRKSTPGRKSRQRACGSRRSCPHHARHSNSRVQVSKLWSSAVDSIRKTLAEIFSPDS